MKSSNYESKIRNSNTNHNGFLPRINGESNGIFIPVLTEFQDGYAPSLIPIVLGAHRFYSVSVTVSNLSTCHNTLIAVP